MGTWTFPQFAATEGIEIDATAGTGGFACGQLRATTAVFLGAQPADGV